MFIYSCAYTFFSILKYKYFPINPSFFLYKFCCNFYFIGGLDLVLAPGVAFTKNGGRCGHGMGYYDKYLESLFRSNPQREGAEKQRGNLDEKLSDHKTILLALAFREQIVPELPLDSTDIILDQVITADD